MKKHSYLPDATLTLLLKGTIENYPPSVSAGANQTLACTQNGTVVTLSAQGTDPDGPADIIAYEWSELIANPAAPAFDPDPDGFDASVLNASVPLFFWRGVAEAQQVTLALDPGVHEMVVSIRDSSFAVAFDEAFITVVDEIAPFFQSKLPLRGVLAECDGPETVVALSAPNVDDNCGPVELSLDGGRISPRYYSPAGHQDSAMDRGRCRQ